VFFFLVTDVMGGKRDKESLRQNHDTEVVDM